MRRIQDALDGLPTVSHLDPPCSMAYTENACELLGSPGELFMEIVYRPASGVSGEDFETLTITHDLLEFFAADITKNGVRSDPFMVQESSGIWYQYIKLPSLFTCDPALSEGCHDALPPDIWYYAQLNGNAVYQVIFSDAFGRFPVHSERVIKLWRLQDAKFRAPGIAGMKIQVEQEDE